MSVHSRLLSYGGSQNMERGYREVNLPLESFSEERDYVSGEELYGALTSKEVRDTLDNYRISSSRDLEGDFEFRASRGPYIGRRKPSYIAFEGEIETLEGGEHREAEHYHLRVEVAAPGEEAMKSLEQDLELLEEGLQNYYTEEVEEARNRAKTPSFAD